jgi:hypothetical protein
MKKYLAIGASVLFLIAFFAFPYITLMDLTLFSSIMLILQNGGGGFLAIIMYGLALIFTVIGLVMIFTNKENKFTRYAGVLAGVAALFDLVTSGSSSSYLGFGFWIILISAVGMAVSG